MEIPATASLLIRTGEVDALLLPSPLLPSSSASKWTPLGTFSNVPQLHSTTKNYGLSHKDLAHFVESRGTGGSS